MPKVLVVDDSLSVRKVVQRALESKRIEVLSAASGSEAMEQIAREAPDLIVCDVIMPDMDGYQICDFVKKHPTLGHTPGAADLGHRQQHRDGARGQGPLGRRDAEALRGRRAPASHREPVACRGASRAGRRAPAVRGGGPGGPVAAAVTAPERRAPQPEPPAPVAEPVAVATPRRRRCRAPDLKALLAGVAELAGVSLTALIDREGALMEVAGGLLPEAELAGALAACLVESTDGVGRALTQGRLQSLILEYDAGVVLLNAVGAGAMLAVVLGDPAVLGKVRYHVKKALPDLVRAV